MSYSVYKHTFPNGKVYIGITGTKPEKRWDSGWGYKMHPLLFNAIRKYGWKNIKHEIIFEKLTKEEAENKEVELIKKYKSNNKSYGYNIANGGTSNGMHSEETKKKISNATKGRNNPFYGKCHSEETKRKISESLVGRKAWNYGKHMSDEQKKKISKTKKGTIMSEEQKEKISISLKGRKRSQESIEKTSKSKFKPVHCVETDKTYPSIKYAVKETGIAQSGISNACSGKYKTAGGYHWKFVEEASK